MGQVTKFLNVLMSENENVNYLNLSYPDLLYIIIYFTTLSK